MFEGEVVTASEVRAVAAIEREARSLADPMRPHAFSEMGYAFEKILAEVFARIRSNASFGMTSPRMNLREIGEVLFVVDNIDGESFKEISLSIVRVLHASGFSVKTWGNECQEVDISW